MEGGREGGESKGGQTYLATLPRASVRNAEGLTKMN